MTAEAYRDAIFGRRAWRRLKVPAVGAGDGGSAFFRDRGRREAGPSPRTIVDRVLGRDPADRHVCRRRAIKLTTSRYYTPAGTSIQDEGIRPDVELANADAEAAVTQASRLLSDARRLLQTRAN